MFTAESVKDVLITKRKGCLDNQQLRSNPGLELANAEGVELTDVVLPIDHRAKLIYNPP